MSPGAALRVGCVIQGDRNILSYRSQMESSSLKMGPWIIYSCYKTYSRTIRTKLTLISNDS